MNPTLKGDAEKQFIVYGEAKQRLQIETELSQGQLIPLKNPNMSSVWPDWHQR